jgi:hypothetical protein
MWDNRCTTHARTDFPKEWSAKTDAARRMDKAKSLVEAFVKDPDLKAHSAQWPSTEGRKNLLLYVDPAYDFVVNAVVRVPGRIALGTPSGSPAQFGNINKRRKLELAATGD